MSGWSPPIRRAKKKRKKKRPLLRFGRVLPRTPQVWIEETPAPRIVIADRPRVVVSTG
jgi:hypothetical protein